MRSENPTTVRLDKCVQKIKEELSPIYGLKNILSAGLLLFSRLSDSEQKKAVAEVNAVSLAGREAAEDEAAAARDAVKQRRKRRPRKRAESA